MRYLASIWAVLKGMMRRIDEGRLSLVAAGGAFFAMLSLFPGLAAVITLLGLISDPMIVDRELELLRDFMPEQAFVVLQNQVSRLISSSANALGWATVISTLAALWSARRGTDAMIQALNTVYAVPQRGGLGTALMAVGLTLALIAVVLVALVTMVLAPLVLSFVPLGPFAATALEALRWVVALGVVLSGIWLLYRFAPNRPGPYLHLLSPGALLAIGVWSVASWGFAEYLRNFGSYNEVYGSIGAVIALLMFLYITIFTVLLGATLNAELETRRSGDAGTQGGAEAVAEMSTEPAGPAARGAVVASVSDASI